MPVSVGPSWGLNLCHLALEPGPVPTTSCSLKNDSTDTPQELMASVCATGPSRQGRARHTSQSQLPHFQSTVLSAANQLAQRRREQSKTTHPRSRKMGVQGCLEVLPFEFTAPFHASLVWPVFGPKGAAHYCLKTACLAPALGL